VIVRASQSGNEDYLSASYVDRSFSVSIEGTIGYGFESVHVGAENTDGFSSIKYIGNGVVLAGRRGRTSEADSIYRSTDYGRTFASVGAISGITGHHVYSFDYHGDVVICGTGDQSNVCMLRSTDAGATWTVLLTTAQLNTLVSATNAQHKSMFTPIHTGSGRWIYVIRNDKGADAANTFIIVSTDDGATWAALSTTGINLGARNMSLVRNGDLFTSSPGFGGLGSGIFKSTNNGVAWTKVSSIVAMCPVLDIGNGVHLVGTADATSGASVGQIYRSDDNGATWTAVLSAVIATDVGYFRWMIESAPGVIVAFISSSEASQTDRKAKQFTSRDGGLTWVDEGTPFAGPFGDINAVYQATVVEPGILLLAAQPDSLILRGAVTEGNVIATLGNLSASFDGGSHAASATTNPGGLNVDFTYDGSATAPTDAGSYDVVGTVSDPNYQGSASGTLIISKATPLLSWDAPASITYGTTLSSTQLAATASVPGAFAYDPAVGNILEAGVHSLGVTFTPNDPQNYTAVIANKNLAVGKAPLFITAGDQSKKQGATNPDLTMSYAGFVNGDAAGDIVVPIIAASATVDSVAGEYPIRLTGGSAANYSLTLVNGTLTVVSSITAPTGVEASDGEFLDRIRIRWDEVDEANVYAVFRSTEEAIEGATNLIPAGIQGARFEDTDVIPDVDYFYWVRIVNAGEFSATSSANSGFVGKAIVAEPEPFERASVGLRHSLFVKADGSLWAMGNNGYGQLGTGDTDNRLLPVMIADGVVEVAAGGYHSMFIKRDLSLWSMGSNAGGQLGVAPFEVQLVPMKVATGVVSVSAGEYHTLFIKVDGSLWAMGSNGSGRLGSGDTVRPDAPIRIAEDVLAVSAGGAHSMFVKKDGSLWLMGSNSSGQLGDDSTNDRRSPVNIASDVVAIDAGESYSLYLKTDGTLWSVGGNDQGQLGDGTRLSRSTPAPIAARVISLSAGKNHSMWVTEDGGLWATGLNEVGALGDGSNQDQAYPIRIRNAVSSVSADGAHTLFIMSSGELMAVGGNGSGRLGDGTEENRNSPVSVSSSLSTQILPPAFSLHPESQNLATGSSHTLQASVSGPEIYYRWAKDSVLIEGATGDGLTLDSVTVGTEGSYALWAINSVGAVRSEVASITVSPTPVKIELGDLEATYDGNPHAVSVSTTPPGVVVNVTYVGSSTVPTNAGSYAVSGTISDANYEGSGTGTLLISKATPNLIWDAPASITYGSPLSSIQLAATTSVLGTFAYDPAIGNVLAVGEHGLRVAFTPDDTANYNGATAQRSLLVEPAPVTITLSSLSTTYNGSSNEVGVSTSIEGVGVAVTYDGSTTAPTNAGSYAVVAVTADPNYTGTASGMLVIAQATPVITWAEIASIIYGAALGETRFNATAGIAGSFSYDPASGSVLNAGEHTLAATFTPTNTINYRGASAQQSLTVNPAAVTITLGSLSAIYDGSSYAASTTTTPEGVAVAVTYNGSPSTPTGAGSYEVVTVSADPNYTGSANGTLVIAKATPVITWSASDAITYGMALSGTQLAATADIAGSFAYDQSVGAVLNAGAHPLAATFTPTDTTNYHGASAQQSLSVNPAAVTITLGSLSATYDGSSHAVGVTTSIDGVTVAITYDGSISAPTGSGSYAVVAGIDDPNYSGSANGTLVIAKAPPVITWSTLDAITYGTALGETQLNATADIAGSFAYDQSVGAVLNAGAHPLAATFTPTDTTNYHGASAQQSLSVNPAAVTITLGSLSATYDGSSHAVGVTTSIDGVTVAITYDGSISAPTGSGSYAVVAGIDDPNYSGSDILTCGERG